MPHITLAAEKLTTTFGFPITNSLLTTWLVMAILFIFAFLSTHSISLVPSGIQSAAEIIIGGLHEFFESVIGHHVKLVFPLLASLFLFIIIANWVGLLPGVGTVGFFKNEAQKSIQSKEVISNEGSVVEEKKEFVPLLRGATADLNTTLALAVFSVIAMQFYGFHVLGFHYGGRFIDFRSPIYFFVGALEVISDTSKIISFAFRLFGNIFAGEVLLAVMAFLMPFIIPLPFLMLELFVGFVQALVFSMLTAVFVNVALSHGEGEAHA
ncbi:F0F1 ATP synthase subunit A [Candidatus Gottesmanbacteria bacterium]|nr:F0F1 ATP synthase subunit A [Candidatus Gottesmanbacteria bacterium]